MGILGVDLHKFRLNVTIIFMKIMLKLLFMSHFWLGVINLKNARKALTPKIDEELIPVAWHPRQQWDWCLPGNEKKGVGPIFIDKVAKF